MPSGVPVRRTDRLVCRQDRTCSAPEFRRWVAGAVVLAAALAIPVLATQGVLSPSAIRCCACRHDSSLADSATEERSAWLAGIAAALALLTRSIELRSSPAPSVCSSCGARRGA